LDFVDRYIFFLIVNINYHYITIAAANAVKHIDNLLLITAGSVSRIIPLLITA